MPQQIQPSQWQQTINTVLPLLTLVLGWILANLTRYLGQRKKIKNMNAILFKETCNNFNILNKVTSEDENVSLPPIILAHECRKLSLSIYESYLDRIDALNANDVDNLCEAYFTIKQLLTYSEECIEDYECKDSNDPNFSVVSCSWIAFEKVQSYLQTTSKGKRFIDDSINDRGAVLSSYAERGELWKKAENGAWSTPSSYDKKTELLKTVVKPESRQDSD